MASVHYLNGTFVEERELLISPRDLGYSRGYAVFDFLITYNGRPFKLEKHIERLFNSAAHIELKLPWSKDEIFRIVTETVARNTDPGEKAIKIMVSGGISQSLMPVPQNTMLIVLVDPRTASPKELYEKGAAVVTVRHTRYAPEAKTNNYIEGVLQVQRSYDSGAIEPIYYDDVQVFEGASSNIWAVIDGVLLTPKSKILAGITREVLLEILKIDIPIRVADFSREQLLGASEVFLTASNKEVMPVTRIDGSDIGDGTVGYITQKVMQQFRDYTSF